MTPDWVTCSAFLAWFRALQAPRFSPAPPHATPQCAQMFTSIRQDGQAILRATSKKVSQYHGNMTRAKIGIPYPNSRSEKTIRANMACFWSANGPVSRHVSGLQKACFSAWIWSAYKSVRFWFYTARCLVIHGCAMICMFQTGSSSGRCEMWMTSKQHASGASPGRRTASGTHDVASGTRDARRRARTRCPHTPAHAPSPAHAQGGCPKLNTPA